MKLHNEFVIDVAPSRAWDALNDPRLVAPCFPGAVLTTYDGDSFSGTVKVKLGPISLTYRGEGTYTERREGERIVVISARGRDARGNGTAGATVTAQVADAGDGSSRVTMDTDLSITGRPAQFGRGVISDVADSMISTFASCVAVKLTDGTSDDAPGDTPEHRAAEEARTASSGPMPTVSGLTESDGPALSATALLGSVAPAIARRVAPGAVVLLGIAVLIGLLRRGRSGAPGR